jgi:hypothetical protein
MVEPLSRGLNDGLRSFHCVGLNWMSETGMEGIEVNTAKYANEGRRMKLRHARQGTPFLSRLARRVRGPISLSFSES